MTPVWDCRAAFTTITSGKVRALWRDGRLRCYNVTGLILDIQSDKPGRKPGHIRTWIANTEHGEITITEKCWTCGGWWKIASVPAEKLWEAPRGQASEVHGR